uniref:Neprilysin, neutral endopeptidase 2 n=1 Tax=Glossina brevipalpis TaxID=37001 RepID=A0A1A9X1W5_9MUSC
MARNPNWWRRRTTLERCLTLLSIFAFIVIIGLITGLVAVLFSKQMVEELNVPPNPAQALHGYDGRPTHNKVPTAGDKETSFSMSPTTITQMGEKSNVCLTTECIHTASAVLSKMKPEIEPCDDFYQFACGTYIDELQIPDDKTSVNTFSVITDKLHEQLKDIIMEEVSDTQPKHFRLPNALYKACMNKTLIEQLGGKPIADISELLGGWPVVKGDMWDTKDKWTWQEAVKNFRRLGLSMDYIIDFSISVDFKNSTRRIIDLDQSYIGLSREFLVKGLNETLVKAYYDYMVDMAVLFGADKDDAMSEMKEALEFEIKLANISLPNEKRRNSSELYNLRTIEQLQKSYPYVDWLDYINALLPTELKVDESELVNVAVPKFFENLDKLLETTKKRTICNYMMWRIHAFSVGFLSEEYRKRQLQYSTVVTGREEQEARWKECVDITAGSNDMEDLLGLSIAVGSLYVRKHFKEDSKANALEMVMNIRNVFHKILEEVDWMDDSTRKEAIKKVESMSVHIGYPDELLDNNKLAEYYEKYEIDSDKYFESFLKMNIIGTDYSFNKLRQPINKTEWLRHARPAIVNAFYSSLENSIQFPAGILQGHFFNAQRPKYMNYGAIGFVIGHEITHGFDDQGRQFDVDGNLVDWWHDNTKKAYLEKAKCIIEQYGNFTDQLTGLKLNGINTQGENIADNGGLKESYWAYKDWVGKNGPEPRLPGLDYTPEQMFWISSAQTWCAKIRKESLKMRITTGVHSPNEFRVLGTLSNTKDFSRDFQCPEGSPMNPVHKCHVW